jgi:hypothetical protein
MERPALERTVETRAVRADIESATALAARAVAHEIVAVWPWQRDEPPE